MTSAGLMALLLATAAHAQDSQLLPTGFFSGVPTGNVPAQVEADMLTFDADTSVIAAQGGVILNYAGYEARGDRLVFNQRTKALSLVGNAKLRDPQGNTYEADSVDVTGGMKQALIRSLTLTTPQGAQITAESVDWTEAVQTSLTTASYAPCGECIDAKGRTIGWRVRAATMVYNDQEEMIYMEEPRLELLGQQVAWLPFLYLPDPTRPRRTGFRFPSVDYDPEFGVALEVPYFIAVGKDTDVLLTPTLLSRQGLLLAGEVTHRFDGPVKGEATLSASGLYQLDPGAYAGTVGDVRWRGAIQTTGRFTPIAEWTVGWSYTAFSDAAYLKDYKFTSSDYAVNEVYATKLGRDDYMDVRLQRYYRLGNIEWSAQDQQATTLPNARYESVIRLADEMGEIDVSARLLGVRRGADSASVLNGVPYVYGYAEDKTHLAFQAGWQKQWITPAGVVVTPYFGVRGDAAYYDGSSPLLPGEQSLFTATPIAAVDFRYPFIGSNGTNTHVVEPIAQIVYRGSEVTAVGITDDDAQSFVFDDTNLFSYNRFSGSDRQETGLRLNVGGHYQVTFADGGYLDLIGGQSFHLAGVNGLASTDTGSATGAAVGLMDDASYVVLGARGQFFQDLTFGGKVQIDPYNWSVERVALGSRYKNDARYSLDLGYFYLAAQPALGVLTNQQEISALAGIPIADYWTLSAGGAWDIARNSWLEASAGVAYDDGYLYFGVDATATGPTHSTPNDLRVTANLMLKGPDGKAFGF